MVKTKQFLMEKKKSIRVFKCLIVGLITVLAFASCDDDDVYSSADANQDSISYRNN